MNRMQQHPPHEPRPLDAEVESTDQRRALATADFHERMARHLDARGRQDEAKRAREAAGWLRGKGRS